MRETYCAVIAKKQLDPFAQIPTDGVNVAYVAVVDPGTGFGALE